MTLQLEELDAEHGNDFLGMTFPAYRHLLVFRRTELLPSEGGKETVQPIAVAARQEGAPVGLALGSLPEGGRSPRLLSVFVDPARRREGIGRSLVERFETLVAEKGGTQLQAVYMTGKPGVAVFEGIVAQRGWSTPEMRMLTIRFSVEEAMSTKWYARYQRRSGFDIFAWEELTEEEEARLRSTQAETGWIAEDLVPWKFDRTDYDRASSIGARLDGEVVGWVINHRLPRGVARFTCSFMRRDLSRRARILPLYSEAIRRLSEESVRLCTLTVPRHHGEMAGFLKRWCAPWAGFSGGTRHTFKQLS